MAEEAGEMNDWRWADPNDLSKGLAPLDPAKDSMIDAVSEAIQWGAREGNRHGESVVWMVGGMFTAQHDAYPAPDDALEILRVGNLEDVLGAEWCAGLDVDEDGRPIVTAELAREWARWWVGENGQSAIVEAVERDI
jgi:hypothetical protein